MSLFKLVLILAQMISTQITKDSRDSRDFKELMRILKSFDAVLLILLYQVSLLNWYWVLKEKMCRTEICNTKINLFNSLDSSDLIIDVLAGFKSLFPLDNLGQSFNKYVDQLNFGFSESISIWDIPSSTSWGAINTLIFCYTGSYKFLDLCVWRRHGSRD